MKWDYHVVVPNGMVILGVILYLNIGECGDESILCLSRGNAF